jgi:hypothetical protein
MHLLRVFGNYGRWQCGSKTTAVLQQFLFHAEGAPFKVLASFNLKVFVKIF